MESHGGIAAAGIRPVTVNIQLGQIPNGFKLSSASSSTSSTDDSYFNKCTPPFSDTSSLKFPGNNSSPLAGVIQKNGKTVLSSNRSNCFTNGKKMILSSSSLSSADGTVFTTCWSNSSTTLSRNFVVQKKGSTCVTSTSYAKDRNGAASSPETDGSSSPVCDSVFLDESQPNDRNSLANTSVFSVADISVSDIPQARSEAENSPCMSANNSLDMFAPTPSAKPARNAMIPALNESDNDILVPATQPSEDSEMENEHELAIVLDSDDEIANTPDSSIPRFVIEDLVGDDDDADEDDIMVPETQECPLSPCTDYDGPSEIECSETEESTDESRGSPDLQEENDDDGNATFLVSPSPMKVSTKQLTRTVNSTSNVPLKLAARPEEKLQPLNKTFVLENPSQQDQPKVRVRNRTFSRSDSPDSEILPDSKNSEPNDDATLNEENLSGQEQPTLLCSMDETMEEFNRFLSSASPPPEKVTENTVVAAVADIKSDPHSPSVPVPSSTLPVHTMSQQPVLATPSPRRGKKLYAEPVVPVKSSPDPPPKSISCSSDSEDEDGENKAPASKVAHLSKRGGGRDTKADREALFETENPRPSTSAALVRHNAREEKKSKSKNSKLNSSSISSKTNSERRVPARAKPKERQMPGVVPKKKRRVQKLELSDDSDTEEVQKPQSKDSPEKVCKSLAIPEPEAISNCSDQGSTENNTELVREIDDKVKTDDITGADPASLNEVVPVNPCGNVSLNFVGPCRESTPDSASNIEAVGPDQISTSYEPPEQPMDAANSQDEPPAAPRKPAKQSKSKRKTAQPREGGKKIKKNPDSKLCGDQVHDTHNVSDSEKIESEPAVAKNPKRETAPEPRESRRRRRPEVFTIDLISEPESDNDTETRPKNGRVDHEPNNLIIINDPLLPTPNPTRKQRAPETTQDPSSPVRPKRNRKESATEENPVIPPDSKRSRKGSKKQSELCTIQSPAPPSALPASRKKREPKQPPAPPPSPPTEEPEGARRSKRVRKLRTFGDGFI